MAEFTTIKIRKETKEKLYKLKIIPDESSFNLVERLLDELLKLREKNG